MQSDEETSFIYKSITVIIYLLAFAGTWAVFWWSYYNFKSIIHICFNVLKPYFIPSENKTFPEKYGEWAVITGATDGIGKQYAFELAKKGMNIVLVSRTELKLIEVSKKIESMHSVKTKYIAVDFSKGKEIYEELRKKLQTLDVGILVNNVGRMYDFPDDLDHISEGLIWEVINVNIGAVTLMTRIITPQMKANKRGIIINISSGSECQPAPLMAVYGSTKTYLRNFTLAMYKELEDYNVQVQLVTPMFVITKMNNYSTSVMKGGILIPDVQKYTEFAVFTIGKTSETTGYWIHGLQNGFMKLLPIHLRTMVAFRMNKKFREEYHAQKQCIV